MTHRRALFIFALSLLVFAASDAAALDLQECLQRGLANSDHVLAAKAAMDQQLTDRAASIPNFLPHLSLGMDQLWLSMHDRIPNLMDIHYPSSLPAQQAALFKSILSQFDFNSLTRLPDHFQNLTLQAYQPLTQLPQIAMYDNIAADAGKLASLNYDVTKDQIALHLAAMYLQALIAEKKVGALRRAAEQMERLLQDGLALKTHGFLTEADYLQMQMHEIEIRLQLKQAANEETYLKSYLAELLNLPAGQIELVEPKTAPPPAADLTWCIEHGGRNRREMKMVGLQEEIARSGRGAAYWSLFPQVGAMALADWNNTGVQIVPDRIYSAGFVLSWNFWGLGQDVLRARSAAFALTKAEHEARAARLELRMAIEKAWLDAQLAHEAAATNQIVLAQAKENFRMQEERFRAGQITTADLLGAQTKLTAAQTGCDAARYLAILADESLTYAVGEHPFSYLNE